jgi:tripartite-type tricarboxylate transporter receptor subunit TctC
MAVTSRTRWQGLPDIPTVAESVPNYVVDGWLGFVAPKGTPSEIVDRLNGEINAVLAEPEIKSRLQGFGAEPLSGSPVEFGKYIVDDTDKWAKVIRAANIKEE